MFHIFFYPWNYKFCQTNYTILWEIQYHIMKSHSIRVLAANAIKWENTETENFAKNKYQLNFILIIVIKNCLIKNRVIIKKYLSKESGKIGDKQWMGWKWDNFPDTYCADIRDNTTTQQT